AGVPVPPGESVLPLPLGGPGVPLAEGGVVVVVLGGDGWVLLPLPPVLLPPGSPAVTGVCGPEAAAVGLGPAGVDVVKLEFVAAADGDVVAADPDAVATDGGPDVPAGWSARACATTTSAKTIVTRTSPSFVR
ncbi:MAG: hypothetical protein WCD11_07605, partial [Solirubrobacteraceae bacterium]